MIFKTPEAAEQYTRVCPLLRLVADEFERISKTFGVEPFVTRILGRIDGDSGIHSTGRAIDFRDETEAGFLYTDIQRAVIIKHVNALFPRSDEHVTIKWHSFKGNPHHFHAQIPNDIRVLHKMLFNID